MNKHSHKIPEAFFIVADFGKLGRETVIDWENCSRAEPVNKIFLNLFHSRLYLVLSKRRIRQRDLLRYFEKKRRNIKKSAFSAEFGISFETQGTAPA